MAQSIKTRHESKPVGGGHDHQIRTSSIINDEDKTMNPRKYYIKLNGIMIDDPAEAVLETDISWYN